MSMASSPARRHNLSRKWKFLFVFGEEWNMANDEAIDNHARLARLIRFLGHDPSNESLLQDAISLAIETGDAAAMRPLCDHLAAVTVTDSSIAAQAVYLMLASSQFPAAVAMGEQAIAGGITDPAVIFNTACAHFYSGNFEAASSLLASLTVQEDCPIDALLIHARALHHEGKLEDAAAMAEKAHDRGVAPPEVSGVLALLRYETGHPSKALELAYEALALDPQQLDALIACASANFELGSIEQARKAWLHTVDAHPDCGRAWSGLAELEFSEMEFESAEEHLGIAVNLMADHIGTWHMLGWIYILKSDSARARSAFEQAYDLDRNFGETHGGLAIADVMEEKMEQARMGIRRALRLNPECLSARFAEMLILQQEGKRKEAEALVNKVLEGPAPVGSSTRKALIEGWLSKHQSNIVAPPPGQH
jgi:tetratricopeptide (TPR) repeat protein